MASKWLIATLFNIFILLALSSIRPLTEQIANQILQQDELYLLYVSPSPNQNIISIFSAYCQQRSNCTLLDQTSQAYHYFTSFIGYSENSYFVIIDAAKHYKYICPIGEYFHTNLLLNFQTQFLDNQLQPYFASQNLTAFNSSDKCMKLVGKNYEAFLGQDQTIKIVFLYAEEQFCQGCQALLKRFKKISKKYFERGVIRFGYFDVIKNDNRLINDEIAPYFLIYINDNFQDPYGVGVEQFQELQSYIKQLIKDTTAHHPQQNDL